ncbi:[protein-PII] uridylyltransferase [Candidatus Rariloculus sp.]|uniref:[protein-PII] uridylyltransferase n=1 Tax=Candidatus Rariloculus sp. TaxID=3101265 RepID=UPI003D109A15
MDATVEHAAAHVPLKKRLDPAALAAALEHKTTSVASLRALLNDANDELKQRFLAREPVHNLVAARSDTVDLVILASWRRFAAPIADTTDFVAVGGYGRGVLHPHSDIDLLLLLDNPHQAGADAAISRFLTFLWDIGLDVGHSVRSLDDCAQQARDDVTVATALMETRLLGGPGHLFEALPTRIGPERMWDTAEFYSAKVNEQIARHHRFHDTAYNLEPNVKSSPGGLRDIQTICWIAQRHFGTGKLDELVERGFLTTGQFRLLVSGREFLWRIRFGLHLLTGRREDRLLFDHQVKLAAMLGYEDASFTLAVEQLMQRYYRTVRELSRLNEMLLQLFEEALLLNDDDAPIPVGSRFQVRHGYLETIDDGVFLHDPSALLEIFLLLEQSLDLKGISARTIALIKQHLWLIDEEFRQNPRHHRLFLDILRASHGVTRTLKRMSTYGVLGLYIPAFGRIVGRMQYDLFHVYTVDEHTLNVVENLRRQSLPRFDHECPNGSAVMQQIEKREIAYLAGLFHDIAKGRGGDHSELGAVDAESFCLEHGMSRYEARLVAWLVKHHLLLSMTAQKKDINDPTVINEFAAAVRDETHLDFLYVLTLADVRGTNPKIWNSWKDTLFSELYKNTKRALRRGLSNPIDQDELILETQTRAQELLVESGIDQDRWQSVWSTFTDEYFLRHRPEEVAWHTGVLATAQSPGALVVDLNDSIAEGLTVIMVYSNRQLHFFSRTTAALDELGLNIVDARIVPTAGDRSLDTYCVLENDGSPITDSARLAEIRHRLFQALSHDDPQSVTVTRRAPRQVRMFLTQVQVSISREPNNQRTVIELVAGDRPGLLFQVGKVFERRRVTLQNAKIATIGERAEDVFFVTTQDNEPLDAEHCASLEAALRSVLSEHNRQ